MGADDRQDYLLDDDEDLLDLDNFDVEMDDDDDDERDRRVSKKRVSHLISKVKQKERGKFDRLADQFKQVYGVSPEEAIQFGLREAQQFHQQGGQTPPVQPPQLPGPGQAQPSAATGQVQPELDPIVAKVAEIDNWRYQEELRRQREREAAEFFRLYPRVNTQEIPKEVIERRSRGGVTLAEAYKLHMADQQVNDAARTAAQDTARSIRQRDIYRSEGQDYGGGGSDGVGSMSAEERSFARNYDMSDKEYVAYKLRLAKTREEEGGY